MSQNESKRPEICQSEPKPAETTQNFKIGKSDIFLIVFVFQISTPNAQIWVFWAKKYRLTNLNEISLVPFFESTDFKFVICFWKLRTQIYKPWQFGSKSINFLILHKFRTNPISKKMISNLTLVFANCEPKSPNLGYFGQKALMNLYHMAYLQIILLWHTF